MEKKNFKRFGFIGRGLLFGIGALIFAALIALMFGWILMLLWNWLMPSLFNLPLITYWQGWGLILLSHLLFKGGGHGSPRGHVHSRGDHRRDSRYGSPIHNSRDMDDFRAEFRSRMKNHWHGYDSDCHDGHSDCRAENQEDENP